jgi:hypothetical protein
MLIIGGEAPHHPSSLLTLSTDSFLDPQDHRWQIENLENSSHHSVDMESQCLKISRWFDPPFISPRQEAVALPLSIRGMFAAFAKVFPPPLSLPFPSLLPSLMYLGLPLPTSHLLNLSSALQ